jgi:hypothetical protein
MKGRFMERERERERDGYVMERVKKSRESV